MASTLISTTSRVQAPHITVKIGNYSFGLYSKTKTTVQSQNKYYSAIKTTYPNYMQRLVVNKVNGALNNYTLTMTYGITAHDDPNMFEKVFSSVSKSRKITFTYGDCTIPTYMYKEEEALITGIKTAMSGTSNTITYTITAVSGSVKTSAGKFNFPAYTHKKPSDVIIALLKNKKYGLQEIFYGMHDIEHVLQAGLILRDDKEVYIPAKRSITPWDYLAYLVTYMKCSNDTNDSTILKNSRYALTVHDDTSSILDGPYFQIQKILTSLTSSDTTSLDYYEIDVGYPGKDFIASFVVSDDQTYSILYDYSQEVKQSDYVYRIGDDGNTEQIFSPTISNSSELMQTTEADKTWWTTVTQYPIKGTLVIRGLLRAVLLMSYIKINVYYFGRKHISSGIYVVTAEEDTVDASGYFTTLTVTRVKGDDDAN